MAAPKILAFAGSAREGSFNKKLLAIAAAGARDAGGDVRVIDLRDFPMPIMDQDLEARDPLPGKSRDFREQMIWADGFLLACPEHNTSMTALLKNALDWASRQQPGEKSRICFDGKTCALFSASPGALGGMRGLPATRALLSNLGTLVLATQVSVSLAETAFADDGSLKDARRQAAVRDLAAELVATVAKLRG